MLREKIEACSEFADLKGIYFLWNNIAQGVTSIQSLIDLRIHYKGKLNLNIDYTILLFEKLEIIEFNGKKVVLCQDFENKSIDIDEFQNWFSKLFVNFLIREDIILLENIKYDTMVGKYVLPYFNIKYKYACYRNLLITLKVLEKSKAGSYYINELLSSLLEKKSTNNSRLSEESLLKKLENQRMQGEKGELYVIDFEKSRLKLRNDISKVKRISVLDVTAGYDIVSFNSIRSSILDRFIEVKTFTGKPHFYWSANEIKVAKVKSKNYFLYIVDLSKISNFDYSPIIICDPISYFDENLEWISKPESYLFEKLI